MSTNGIDNEVINEMLRNPDVMYIIDTLGYTISERLNNDCSLARQVDVNEVITYLKYGTKHKQPFILKLLPSYTDYISLERRYLETTKSKCILNASRKGMPKKTADAWMKSLKTNVSNLADTIVVIGDGETKNASVSVSFDRGEAITVDMLAYFRDKLYRAAFINDEDGTIRGYHPSFMALVNEMREFFKTPVIN